MKQSMNWLEDLSASVRQYYGAITDEEEAENEEWGRFAATQFPDYSYPSGELGEMSIGL
jgi:hypothetical protein